MYQEKNIPSSCLDTPQPTTEQFLNRELSWLEFNRRVLHEALDSRTPLLERLKFLAIFTSNLDEFFMKRVGGLKRQLAAGVAPMTPDALSPREQLTRIRQAVIPLLSCQAESFEKVLHPALREHGIHLLSWRDLTPQEKESAHQYFRANVFPVLTPLAVDPGHPFPYLSNLSTSFGITLRHANSDEPLFTRLKIPEVFPPWIRLETSTHDQLRFLSLQELIGNNLESLFPDMTIANVMAFRVTRNADIERDEEDAEDLLEMIEEELRLRRFAHVVRLEHGPNPHPWMLQFLIEELEITEEDVYELPAELDYTSLRTIAELPIPQLRYEPWSPIVPAVLADEEANIFSIIRRNDLLVHHPFESFGATVERFIRTAVEDPKVVAIKMTVYRTGDSSPFMPLLIRAAEEGKQVVCLVELKARFEEERNISWAQALEKAGVHVVYGIVGLKTHAKLTLVVREETEGFKCYAHISTGNYHVQTASTYTDLGLFTCKKEITDDIVELFHHLTGRSFKRDYRKMLVAPLNMRDKLIALIDREIDHAAHGRPAQIIVKVNSLEDYTISRALYKASQAGVKVQLIVRSSCALLPGIVGLSENISVVSVIGRFLEHSRLFYLQNGATHPQDGEFYLSSADWMTRNFLWRVEVAVPIEDPTLRERCWHLLQTLLSDQRQAWDMKSDGTYVQRTPVEPELDIGSHQLLMRLSREQAVRASLS